YTKSFEEIQPFSIHAEICRRMHVSHSPLQWDIIKNDIFQQEIGNNDILVNSINQYSPIISITAGVVNLKDSKTYAELEQYVDVDISLDRNNKEYFFDLFSLPVLDNHEQEIQNSDIT